MQSVRARVLLLVAACWGAASAQEIRITSGPVDNQVFQRTAEQTADISFSGAASGKKVNGKDVEARLVAGDSSPVPGFDWSSVAKIQKLKWGGELKRVPVGGPYRLEVRLQGGDSSISISNLLVGDLWVLAGQSNMEGHGDLIDVQQPSPMVHSFDMADRWLVAEEPLHTVVNAVDAVHWPLNAERVPERLTGQPLENYVTKDRKSV